MSTTTPTATLPDFPEPYAPLENRESKIENNANAPALLALRLLRRLHAACPSFATSIGLILGWTREEIQQRNAAADTALAIDDPLEAAEADLNRALANDPAPLRRRLIAAWRETHRRTQSLAQSLRLPGE